MTATRTLSRAAAKAFYDRFGERQDRQGFYEDPALDDLVAHAAFDDAQAVVELGCGTGRLAERLLARHLPATATYWGGDLSATMVELARRRLAPFGERATVEPLTGDLPLPLADAACDRFLSTYVLDLLPEGEIATTLAEAHRLLRADGLLCLVGITPGSTLASRIMMRLWKGLHTLRPALVGGCRPLALVPRLDPKRWTVDHHRVVSAYGVASEVLVARSATPPGPAPRTTPGSSPDAAARGPCRG